MVGAMDEAIDTGHELTAGIIDRATAYVLNPPRGDDPVIDFASPDELVEAFESKGPALECVDGVRIAAQRVVECH